MQRAEIKSKPARSASLLRARRPFQADFLQCDLRKASCGQCHRAKVACTGYRDTQQLRIKDQSQDVRRKAVARNEAPPFEPRSLTPSLEWQARDAFFAYCVTGSSKTWDFLKQFYDQIQIPEHLSLSIDAVSLAYLAHSAYSDVAFVAARERYVSALRMTNKALQSPEAAAKDTTLVASLLLDLFEKITNTEPRHEMAWAGHVHGALALVRLRGLDQFQDPSALRVLVRLSINLLTSCIASESPVPNELVALRAHVAKYLDVRDPKWRLSDLMVPYANLCSDMRRGQLFGDDCIRISMELDAKLQALALDMPPSWQYKTTILDSESERIYNYRFDSYPDRHTTRIWNVIRLVRIILSESVLRHCAEACLRLLRIATDNIETLACEICASVPQYVDCFGAARGRLSMPEESSWPKGAQHTLDGAGHLHSLSQSFDCYTLIFPLYVAGWSRGSPNNLKTWVIEQLHYIGSHFGIRNAALVGRILQQGIDVNPSAVYAMLGSYAFAT
jgi:hypothetical protein